MQDEGGSPSPVRGCLCSCDPLASSLVLAQWWACPGLGGQSRLSWVSPVGAGSLWAATLAVGEGRREASFASELLAETSRSSRVPVAAAKGLSLVGVDYPDDAELAARAAVTRDRRHAL